MNRSQIWALVSMIIIASLVLLFLMCSYLRAPISEKVEESPISLSEEFIEVIDLQPVSPTGVTTSSSTAIADEPKPSQPSPQAGTDLIDAGPESPAPAPVLTAEQQQAIKLKKEKEEAERAAAIKKREEEEAIRRKANSDVADAFKRAQGEHNAATSPNDDQGNGGRKDGNAPQGMMSGNGMGTASGGWQLPAYAKVPSTVTGSVKMKVTIDGQGNPIRVQFIGGDPPAATNTAVRNACEAEVKSRKFIRADIADAPPTATAYITYRFK